MRYLLSVTYKDPVAESRKKNMEVNKRRHATLSADKTSDPLRVDKGILPWHVMLTEPTTVAVVDIEDPKDVFKFLDDFSEFAEASATPLISLQEYRKKFPSQ